MEFMHQENITLVWLIGSRISDKKLHTCESPPKLAVTSTFLPSDILTEIFLRCKDLTTQTLAPSQNCTASIASPAPVTLAAARSASWSWTSMVGLALRFCIFRRSATLGASAVLGFLGFILVEGPGNKTLVSPRGRSCRLLLALRACS